jgi:hypothetical protein
LESGTVCEVPVLTQQHLAQETFMGLGRGCLLWMIGVPLPIIILIALFWR